MQVPSTVPPVLLLDEEGKAIDLKAAKVRTAVAREYVEDCRTRKFKVTRKGRTYIEEVRGPKADPCVALLFAGPPRYGDDDAWSQEKIGAWAEACIKWTLKSAGKGCRIAHCALHQDEAAPHLHLVLVAADEKGRLGWNRIRQGFGTGKERGPELMSAMQSSFHLEVGKQHGLERGEVGSKATHQPIDRQKGLELRIAEELKPLQGRVAAEKNRADTAEERAAEAVGKRLAAEKNRADTAEERAAKAVTEQEGVEGERNFAQQSAEAVGQAAAKMHEEIETLEAAAVGADGEIETLKAAAVEADGEIETLKAARDQAQRELKRAEAGRKQVGVNFDAMVGVVRELGVDRGDFDAAARRAGFGDAAAQFLRSKVGPGRGQER